MLETITGNIKIGDDWQGASGDDGTFGRNSNVRDGCKSNGKST